MIMENRMEKMMDKENGNWGLQRLGFPKIRGTLLGVPIIRTIVYWAFFWETTICMYSVMKGL